MTASIIQFSKVRKPDLLSRTQKLSITALALAIEEYSYDKNFCREARSSLRRHNNSNVCMVTPQVFQVVASQMDLESAIAHHVFEPEVDKDV